MAAQVVVIQRGGPPTMPNLAVDPGLLATPIQNGVIDIFEVADGSLVKKLLGNDLWPAHILHHKSQLAGVRIFFGRVGAGQRCPPQRVP